MVNSNEASGVEELIQRLRERGVEEGKAQADALVEQARQRAEQRLADARQEAEQILQRAREDAEQMQRAGEEAVRLAMRDAMLSLKSELVAQFRDRVRRLVTKNLGDEGVLKQLVLEIGRRAAPPTESRVTVLLPQEVIGLEQLRDDPEEVREGTLSHFVASVTKEMLREGLELDVRDDTDDAPSGIRVRLVEDDLEIDLTDRAISDLLLRHLVPRFRAIMEGIVR